MTPAQFIAKWKPAELKERAACQEHFIDLCRLLDQKTPGEADSKGDWYTFEYGVTKDTGGQGFADVWRKDCFGWEYKGKKKDLAAAFRQLSQYRESLFNPPLLVVCDLNRFEVHTNFPNTAKEVHAFDLDGLAEPKHIEILRRCFADPQRLKPGRTQKQVTEEVAQKFAAVATAMQKRGIDPHKAGHFLMKAMFCMFAEDIGLFPSEHTEHLFLDTLLAARNNSKTLSTMLADLFGKMESGGRFGHEEIPHFNGGLFKDAEVVNLATDEIGALVECAKADWGSVEPSIFGTLFERILNPDKRSQLGAHYTGKDDILTLLEPVLMAPLRREWAAVKAEVEALWGGTSSTSPLEGEVAAQRRVRGSSQAANTTPHPAAKRGDPLPQGERVNTKSRKRIATLLTAFHERLAHTIVLDPACGSGNFLYVSLNLLLDLEKEVRVYATTRGLHLLNLVSPSQLRGIELNPYAQELAQVVIWIGYLQWTKFNGNPFDKSPVLDSMENIECRDAILDLSDPANPKEPEWPEAEYIVGNPPFLGDKKMRAELGDAYVDALRKLYDGRLPGGSDLVCYWFEKARAMIGGFVGPTRQRGLPAASPTEAAPSASTFREPSLARRANKSTRPIRAGLIATQGIRGGANRACLDRIAESGGIFFAVADRDWVLDGATVHVSIVGFDGGIEAVKSLNGVQISEINSDLSTGSDSTKAMSLSDNLNLSFIGVTKGGDFDISEAEAVHQLMNSGNPNGRPNSDLLLPITNGKDALQRLPQRWVINTLDRSEHDAALYQHPFETIVARVKPTRNENRDKWLKTNWWKLQRSRPEMQKAIVELNRFIVIPRVSKHRICIWFASPIITDDQMVVFAFSDDYRFGVLHSSIHEKWAFRVGTQLRERESGFRYGPTMCFETFPFPTPTDPQREAIASAAKELDALRNNWLNPPEWTRTETLEFPGSVEGPWKRYVTGANLIGIGTVKYPRLVPKDAASAALLKNRTLTKLYNKRPTWLANAHRKLDDAVFAAYGWPSSLSDDDLLAKLLELNLARAVKE